MSRAVVLGLALSALCCPCFGGAQAAATSAPKRTSAEGLFALGEFAAAAEAGRAERSATSLAIAAQATLIRAAYLTTDRGVAKALVLVGERDADDALRLDPRNYDGLFQRASGIGYRATLANSPGLAKQARDLFAGLTRSEPARAEAWLGLAAWNGEALDQLGRMMASVALGAKASAMEAAFAEAERRWPNNPLPFAYHGTLVLRLSENDAPRARALLQAAVRKQPRLAYEGLARSGAAEVLALMEQGDVAGARKLARKLGAFGKLGR